MTALFKPSFICTNPITRRPQWLLSNCTQCLLYVSTDVSLKLDLKVARGHVATFLTTRYTICPQDGLEPVLANDIL